MKKLSTVFRTAALIILSVTIGIKLYIWNARTLVGNEMPMPFGIGASVVLSGSMEPELSVDDLVFVREQDDYKTGDVVVYQDGRSLVIHRIIEVTEEGYITKGDANNTADEPISCEAVKGRMTGRISGAGKIIRFIRTPVFFVLLMILAVIMFELPYFMERKKVLSEQERLKEEIRRLRDE